MNERQAALDNLRDTCNTQIKLQEALERLLENDDFDLVFTEHLLNDQLVTLALRKGDPNAMTESIQADIDAQISAMGRLSHTMRRIIADGRNAPMRLQEIDETERQFLEEPSYE